ncbi:hypothetical protein ACFLSF_03750 [Candidatus Bipolaricaulota bacterium]
MKAMVMLGAISLLVLIGAGLDRPGAILRDDDSVIAAKQCYIDSDGREETLEVLVVSGQRYVDEILWCGMGDKWEGEFDIRVRGGQRIPSRGSLNELMAGEILFFHAPQFDLVVDDYNGDGKIDFNVGQYAVCNRAVYFLFAIARDGHVTRLGDREHYMGEHLNSTPHILFRDGLVAFTYYSQQSGVDETEWCQWNGERFEEVTTTPATPGWWRLPSGARDTVDVARLSPSGSVAGSRVSLPSRSYTLG